MGFAYLVLLILVVIWPRLWRYVLTDVLAQHRARTAAYRTRGTFRERLRRAGPWAWRTGADA